MKKSILTITAICAFSMVAGISDANAHSHHKHHNHHHAKHKQVVVIKKKPIFNRRHVVVVPKRFVRTQPHSLFSFNIRL